MTWLRIFYSEFETKYVEFFWHPDQKESRDTYGTLNLPKADGITSHGRTEIVYTHSLKNMATTESSWT